MKALVVLALLGVAAAYPHDPTESKQGVIPETKSYPKVIAYSYPFFGGSPFYHPGFPYTYPFAYPFMFPSPAVKKYEGEGKYVAKSVGESSAREKRSAEAEADAPTYYTTYPYPTATTYKFPAATFPAASPYTTYKFPASTFPAAFPYTTYKFPASTFPAAYPYTKFVPLEYATFPYTVVKKPAEKAENDVIIIQSPAEQ